MTIVAIGGGEISEKETIGIDKEIVDTADSDNPKALFIPTASGDAEGYIKTFEKIYAEELNCEVETLKLTEESASKEEIEEKVLSADLIYVGGGNTKKMLEIWEKHDLQQVLKKAEEEGVVLSGISAGAVCWFEKALIESENTQKYEIEDMLDLKDDAVICPHYNQKEIREAFKQNTDLKDSDRKAIALEDRTAIKIEGNNFEILKSDSNAEAYEISRKNGSAVEEAVDSGKL